MTSGQAHNINLFTVKTASDLCIIRKQRKLIMKTMLKGKEFHDLVAFRRLRTNFIIYK